MRICSYMLANGEASFGLYADGAIKDAGQAFRARYPDIRAVLTAGALPALREAAAGGEALDPKAVRMLPPITNPDKILCIGLNYMTHIRETGRDKPTKPTIFTRYPSSVIGDGQELIRPKVSDWFDFEGELAFVIGKRGRAIPASRAMEHVAGYSCFNDGSIRDFQRHTSQFWAGKNFDATGSMGPWLVTSDELPDITAQTMTTRLNGEVMQHAAISDLAFDIPTQIEYLSTVTELLPGDIVATGTPSGVGLFREPKLFMKPGDRIEVEISGIGTLVNPVVDEA